MQSMPFRTHAAVHSLHTNALHAPQQRASVADHGKPAELGLRRHDMFFQASPIFKQVKTYPQVMFTKYTGLVRRIDHTYSFGPQEESKILIKFTKVGKSFNTVELSVDLAQRIFDLPPNVVDSQRGRLITQRDHHLPQRRA